MSDAGPSQSVQEGKRKRRVKKKTTTLAQEAAPVVAAERPNKRSPLTTYDREVYDYVREATSKNVWYYRDRLSVPRGPCNISVLRECWVHGVIDDGTLVWGQGLIDWLPVKNVRTLVPQIRTLEDMLLYAVGSMMEGEMCPIRTPNGAVAAAVQVATWIKRQFALKPAINRMRRERAEQRKTFTNQIDNMY